MQYISSILIPYSIKKKKPFLQGVYLKYTSELYFKCTTTHAVYLKYTDCIPEKPFLQGVYLKYTSRTVLQVYYNLCSIFEVYLLYT